MAFQKYQPGEQVEMRCLHRRAGEVINAWLAGVVVQTDDRMVAVRFEVPVFANPGWPIADRVLWCAHGSPNLRRPAVIQE